MSELTEQQYEKRFWQRNDGAEELNVVGYGVTNPFVPPIQTPKTILEVMDRQYLVYLSNGPWTVFTHYLWTALIDNYGKGDSSDGFVYNNAEAAGSQLYPQHLGKYYDLYSWDGFFMFVGAYYWISIKMFLSNYMGGLPLDAWEMIFNGAPLGNLWMYYVFYNPFGGAFWASILGMKMESGWPLM